MLHGTETIPETLTGRDGNSFHQLPRMPVFLQLQRPKKHENQRTGWGSNRIQILRRTIFPRASPGCENPGALAECIRWESNSTLRRISGTSTEAPEDWSSFSTPRNKDDLASLVDRGRTASAFAHAGTLPAPGRAARRTSVRSEAAVLSSRLAIPSGPPHGSPGMDAAPAGI